MKGRGTAWLAAVVSVMVMAFGLVKGTWAAGGSDSSCYALMADAFAAGEVQPFTTLAIEAPWPDAARTFAPAGFIPSSVVPGAASPICAPGFSLLLAPFRLVAGRDAIFFVTPLAGALLVWLSFVVGRRLVGPWTGATASLTVATIPILLFQVTQPMNDVVVTTVWMAVLAASFAAEPSRPWLLGALAGLATLIRPNLAPASVLVAVWMVVAGRADAPMLRSARGAVWRRHAIAFGLGAAPSLIVLFGLNTRLYGHPFQSGYGRAADLFSVENLWPNLQQYGRAVFETQLGLPLLGVLAVLLPKPERATVGLALGISAAMVAVYLLYRPYPEWWYLRFLLPALAPLTVLAIAILSHGLSALVRRRLVRAAIATSTVIALAWFGIATAKKRQAFELQQLESRFRRAGEVVRDQLPANAVLIAVWQSGTVRFHAGRASLLWDSLDPAALESAVTWLLLRGFEPYLVLERWEEPLFRDRFMPATSLGQLDWPPRFDIVRQVRIFKPADREIYLKGGTVPTSYILR
jgi:Dolichyl-phosphate-mannose-protein mannosyltransferase